MKNKLCFLFVFCLFLIAFGSTNVTASTWGSNLNEGLVTYYSFDGASDGASAVYNIIGNSAWDMDSNAGSPTVSTGKVSNGGVLSANGDRWTSGSTAIGSPFSGNEITLCMWVKPSVVQDEIEVWFVMQDSDVGSPSNWLYYNKDGTRIQWNARNDYEYYTVTLSAETWYFSCLRQSVSKVYTISHNGANVSSTTYEVADTGDINQLTGDAVLFIGAEGDTNFRGVIDEIGIWNRSLTDSEIENLYNSGTGLTYSLGDGEINLISPEDDYISSSTSIDFNVSIAPPVSYNNSNLTLFVWHSNNSLFNSTTNTVTGNDTNYSFWSVEDFNIGDYIWGAYGCFENSTGSICQYNAINRTFSVGLEVTENNYQNYTYETKSEEFSINVSLLSGSEISLAQLVYNGTNYTVSSIESNGNNRTLTKTIDIPLNPDPSSNTTRNFFWRFVYTGDFSAVQETSTYTQNVSFIKFQQCNATYTAQALNFTFYDEKNQTVLENTTANPTTFESSWKYWIGDGGVYKNYSFQNLSSSLTDYQFCIYPYLPNNYIFKTSGDIEYFATNYRENEYYLRNATLSNVSSDILLYLIHENYATKFFLTFQQGSSLVSNAVVTVQKYFTGLGQYVTTSILLTDDDGVATMWQEVDSKYKYSVTKDGVLLGEAEKVSVCSVAPCSLDIILDDPVGSIYEPYGDIYALNIISTLVYNESSKIVTYSFLDTTGLANYFRLTAQYFRYNETGTYVCDDYLYSSAGTLTCNLTAYSGEFIVIGYVSRSPELVDKILNVITIDDMIDDIGRDGLLLIISFLVTVVFAFAVISKGSPSAVLASFGIAILLLKLMGWFPFTWTIVVALEFVVWFIIWRVKV